MQVLNQAILLKKDPYTKDFLNKELLMVFEKPSNRTRLSFEIGMKQLGGSTVMIHAKDIGWPNREPMKDLASVMSRYADMVMIRCLKHRDLCEFAKYARIPVINALTDRSHPCQALADVLTMMEAFGSVKGLNVTYVGDVNNVCVSLAEIAAVCDFTLTVSCPKSVFGGLPEHVIYCEDPIKAANKAHVLYTDVWVSMGQESETEKRLKLFDAYQVNDELMQVADKNAIFLHCLPAKRGLEVSESVIDGRQSKIYDQAENRMHVQKALMKALLYT